MEKDVTDIEKICNSIDGLNETLKEINKNLECLVKLEAQNGRRESSQMYVNTRGY